MCVINSKIKILYLLRKFDIGGAETFLLSLVKLLRDKYQIKVVSLYNGGILQREFEALGISTTCAGFGHLFDFKSYYRLIKILRQFSPDILHTKLVHADLVGRLAGRVGNVPVVLSTVENAHEWENLKGLKGIIKAMTYRYTLLLNKGKVIPVSFHIASLLEKKCNIHKDIIEVIENAVDTKYYAPCSIDNTKALRKKFGIEADCFCVGVIGTLSPIKDHKTFLEAASRIIQRIENTRFLIVGRGNVGELQRYCKQLGIANSVLFLGPRRDIRDILCMLDVFVLSSLSEGLSMTLLEAMSMQKGVVVTAVAGNRRLVTHGKTGFLVKPQHPHELAAKVLELLEDRKLLEQLGAEAQKFVTTKYDISIACQAYHALYQKMLGASI